MSIPDLFRLNGKVAIVTGASSGLGVACAVALAEAGADVAIAARRASALADTAVRINAAGGRALVVPTDVTDPEACDHLAAETVAGLGRVDILVNNAGIASAVPALRETPEEFRSVVDLNLNGSFWMAQAAARHMTDGGSIINISSALALTTAGLPQAAYAASKAGVLGMTRDLAQQWTGRLGIRVNAICPGFFDSEMTASYDDEYREKIIRARILAGRPGRPAEFAATVVFLAGAGAGYITGTTLVVDGGVNIT